MINSGKRIKLLNSDDNSDVCEVLELYLSNIELIGQDDSLEIIRAISKNGTTNQKEICSEIYSKFQQLNAEIQLHLLTRKRLIQLFNLY